MTTLAEQARVMRIQRVPKYPGLRRQTVKGSTKGLQRLLAGSCGRDQKAVAWSSHTPQQNNIHMRLTPHDVAFTALQPLQNNSFGFDEHSQG